MLRIPSLLVTAMALSFVLGLASVRAQEQSAAKKRHEFERPLLNLFCFEENQGQFDARATFGTRGPDFQLYLCPDQIVLFAFNEADRNLETRTGALVGIRPRGGALNGPVGDRKLQGIRNYFIGNDPEKWQTGVRTWSRVAYREVYPGIDLVFHGGRGALEFDFVVHPGADPSQIAVDFPGVESLCLDAAGGLQLDAGPVSVRLSPPTVFDSLGQLVASEYIVDEQGVRFSLGPYDSNRLLTIDPIVEYSTYVATGVCWDSTVDADGDVYLCGWTGMDSNNPGCSQMADFPTGFGPSLPPGGPVTVVQLCRGSGSPAFILKFTPDSTAPTGADNVVFGTYLGGMTGSSFGRGISVDAAETVYITGSTASSTFPVSGTPAQATSAGGIREGFVAKIEAEGSILTYSTYLGGSSQDNPWEIALDSAGNFSIVGWTQSTDLFAHFPMVNPLQLPFMNGAIPAFPPGTDDAIVVKFDPNGQVLFSTYLGGSGSDQGQDIGTDAVGNIYIGGITGSSNFPTTAAAYDTVRQGLEGFVTKISTAYVPEYSTYIGESANDFVNAIAVDLAGVVYFGGKTGNDDSLLFSDAGRVVLGLSPEDQNGLIGKLKPDGLPEFIAGLSNAMDRQAGEVTGICFEPAPSNRVVVVHSQTDPLTGGVITTDGTTYTDTMDAVVNPRDVGVAVISADATTVDFATLLGGEEDERFLSLSCDDDGFAYVAGTSTRVGAGIIGALTYPTTSGAFVWTPPMISNTSADSIIFTKFEPAACDTTDPMQDCNSNGTIDNCELAFGFVEDCNDNNIPDSCDILSMTSEDLDFDGIPDECQELLVVGEVNNTAGVDLGDAIAILNYIFPNGGMPVHTDCIAAMDVDDNGFVSVADVFLILQHEFGSGIGSAAFVGQCRSVRGVLPCDSPPGC